MKFIHTADIHFGSNTYGRIDPETGLNTRLLDVKRSFDWMVQSAVEEEVDLFLFCGDAYRTADPTPTQQRAFAECLRPLADHGIPIVMIVGNHDHPVSFGKASAIDIFGYITGDVHVYSHPGKETIHTKSGPLQLLVLPWPIRSILLSKDEHRKKSPAELRAYIEQRYVAFLQDAAEGLDPEPPTVLAGHVTVQGAEIAGSEMTSVIAHEPMFTIDQLAVPGIDYVALGHIHRRQDRNEGSAPPVVYCGSIERISFKEWEDPKGFVVVSIENKNGKKETSYSFKETPARPFVPIQIDARQSAYPTETIIQAIERVDIQDAVVRIRYFIDEIQIPQIDLRRIREVLKTAHIIASIERTVEPIERRRRSILTRESSLEEAMRQYLAQHEHLASVKDDLLQAALSLEIEYEAQRKEE